MEPLFLGFRPFELQPAKPKPMVKLVPMVDELEAGSTVKSKSWATAGEARADARRIVLVVRADSMGGACWGDSGGETGRGQ